MTKIYLDRNVEDVNLGAPADDDLLVYDEATQKWVNKSLTVTCSGTGGGSLTIEEADGTPSVVVSKLIVPNGSLTDDGGGQGTLTFTAGGAGATDILQVQVFS